MRNDGQLASGYPVALEKDATGPLSLMDYDGKQEWRILVPSSDHKMHDYDISGNPVKGWKDPGSTANLNSPVKYLVYKKRDYLFISDEKGRLVITDRRGRNRVNVPKNFLTGFHPTFYINETNSKAPFLTTDENGKLTYINLNGKLSRTSFGDFNPDHYFLYEDFNGDGDKDFIFLDKNKLIIFDRLKKVLFQYNFDEVPNSAPVFIDAGKGNTFLGITVKGSHQVYIFDKIGNILDDNILKGMFPVNWFVDNLGKRLQIICADEDVLTLYEFSLIH